MGEEDGPSMAPRAKGGRGWWPWKGSVWYPPEGQEDWPLGGAQGACSAVESQPARLTSLCFKTHKGPGYPKTVSGPTSLTGTWGECKEARDGKCFKLTKSSELSGSGSNGGGNETTVCGGGDSRIVLSVVLIWC